MIKLENFEVVGWEHALRGMRNPMNSWEKSDSCSAYENCIDCNVRELCDEQIKRGEELTFFVGPNDHELMMKLAKGGPVHAKYRRMITVYVDITAPLYWWKEFDTYKVGTVANSCSTMHKIHAKEFTIDDFSHERMLCYTDLTKEHPVPIMDLSDEGDGTNVFSPYGTLSLTVNMLNLCRDLYLEVKDTDKDHAKRIWDSMIQLLPSSYNQKRTVMLNYEVLTGIYPMRKNHKLDEWREFCQWIETLPYSEVITELEPMKCLTHKFIKVTEHYGYQYKTCTESGSDEPVFVVCRVDDHTHHISGYYSRKEAQKCCHYLEKLNYSEDNKRR